MIINLSIIKKWIQTGLCLSCLPWSMAMFATETSFNAGSAGNPYQQWELGPSKAKDYFPIAVWMQDPKWAPKYQDAGINLYIALWQGPTEEQLADLKKFNMPLICEPNEVALAHLKDPMIVGWLQPDEPDNAKPFKSYWGNSIDLIQTAWPGLFDDLGANKPYVGYGPPIPWSWIIRCYETLRAKDPRRPILLGVGDGVVRPAGCRGERTGKTEDYLEYVKGCDIFSFDTYPVNYKTNRLHIADGVTNLRKWSKDGKVVWNCMECTGLAKPRDTRAEVWMGLIHGSMGIIYFVHELKEGELGHNDHALLDHPEMLAAVTKINHQIHDLAPVLNSPSSSTPATVVTSNKEIPVDSMTKAIGTTVYVFSVAKGEGETKALFTVPGVKSGKVAVLGENRTIQMDGDHFEDGFQAWDVHLYEITP